MEKLNEYFNYLTENIKEVFSDLEIKTVLSNSSRKYKIMNVELDEKIMFKQIIDLNDSKEENLSKLTGSVKRNLNVFESLKEQELSKNNELLFVEQAEIIYTRKLEETPNKKKK